MTIDPGESRITLLAEGAAAFAARLASARNAQHTLDLQYYLWHGDLTGALLARAVLQAADRGVQVRILLDDLALLGEDGGLTALAAHPHIRLRRFNPGRWRRWGRHGYLLEMLFGAWHLHRRMHNKAWIADGARLICGGRNIGDRYFDAGSDFNFRDLDIVIEGPPAAEAARIFDAYWRSPLSRRIRGLARLRAGRGALRRLRRRLGREAAIPNAQPLLRDRAARPGVAVGSAAIRVFADPPAKAQGGAAGTVAPALAALLAGAEREALLISPYFVPGQAGVASLIALARAGVRVAIITNSLAATDVMAVHGAYARYRRQLLAEGVEIHELKARQGTASALGDAAPGSERPGWRGQRGRSLHTKAVLVDGSIACIGSFNLDPRSEAMNTEMAVRVDHPGIARLLRQQHRRYASGGHSWRVTLEAGRLVWDDGQQRIQGAEPQATRARRMLAWLLARLPIERYL